MSLLLSLLLLAADAPREIPLWPKGAPGSPAQTVDETVVPSTDGVRRIATIHTPSISVHLPPREKASGAGVVVLPGGGHRYLSIDNEGHAAARWLAERGIAAFVLKYRLARQEGSTYTVEGHALPDAQRALRLVRSRAKEWDVDPERVGILGFSAGGQLATYAAARFDAGQADAEDPVQRESSRPAFQALLYPGAVPADTPVPKDAPPAFVCVASDDREPSRTATALFQRLREAGVSAELHVYAKGGHGFGMRDRPFPITGWPLRFHEWMADQGFLAGRASARVQHGAAAGFTGTVQPFLQRYCSSCHNGEKAPAQLDLGLYTTVDDVVRDHERWAVVVEKLAAGEMPPADEAVAHGLPLPDAAARRSVTDWFAALRRSEARDHAGDPGVVLARRLSNAEYDYTIRDLTGLDLRPAREFPVDPANPAGFDNSGESLSMSAELMGKYLQAARGVADHLVLRPGGLAFAPHPMVAETDRDKYCVKRIVDFYQRQPTDYADYFQAAWRYKHRAALRLPAATLAREAAASRVSPKYLATIWRTLEGPRQTLGPLARLQADWRALPPPSPRIDREVRAACERMRDFVVALRKKTAVRHAELEVKGIGRTAQPFLMWRNHRYAASRLRFDPAALQVEGEGQPPAQPDPDLRVPAGGRAAYEAAFARFAAAFPDAFYISERGRYFPDPTRDTGRHLSAGFHNLVGYFRDDAPLYQLVLDEKGRQELDALWQDLDFVASATERTYVQFYLSESVQARPKDSGPEGHPPAAGEITAEPMIRRVAEGYLAKARASENEAALEAVQAHFDSVNAALRRVEKARREAEPRHVEALLELASRAYRRALSPAERADLTSYYRSRRKGAGLGHEEALRDVLVSVLMSPDFCYRIDVVGTGAAAQPLSDHALASRLSYFLWSSLPDGELLARAAAGELRRPEVLAQQARRMLRDDRVAGLATEFGGHWLNFRRFQEHNAVDRERFPVFDAELRQAMFEEPVRFMVDVFRQNRSVLDFLYAKHTFVNPALAKHYGMDAPSAGWQRVADADRYGRGGLLPMSVFLTKNAPGLRTSPVKRGYWVVKELLGERIPPPPAMVPELPRDEAKLELPLRDALARHRQDPACASCHSRFDSFGLVFEGYGPVGERRTTDLAGRPVDASATFPGGGAGSGLEGLRDHVRAKRQADFLDNLCRKLLAFALGRGLALSDEPTVKTMQAKLARNGYRFDSLVESIVLSPQFRTKRGGGPGGRGAGSVSGPAVPPARTGGTRRVTAVRE